MLNNKWIISDKERVASKPGYLYTLILIDGDINLYKTDHIHVQSDKNLNIGDFFDYNLNPLNIHYKTEQTDIANVEFANTFNVGNADLQKISLFGINTGCFNAFITKQGLDFPIRRGDELSIFAIKGDPVNSPTGFMTFKLMQNLTTDQKSPDFEYVVDNFEGNFEELVVVGRGAAGTNEEPAKKGMLISSPKFGYIYSVVSSKETLFFTRTNDKLLIERNPRTNAFEILRNITADNIRAGYLLQK